MEQTMEPVAQTTPAQSAVETPTPAGAPGSAPTPPKSKKKRKKTTRRIIALVLVIALGFGLYRHFGKKEGAGEQQVVKDTVMTARSPPPWRVAVWSRQRTARPSRLPRQAP